MEKQVSPIVGTDRGPRIVDVYQCPRCDRFVIRDAGPTLNTPLDTAAAIRQSSTTGHRAMYPPTKAPMPIRSFLPDASFEPEVIALMGMALEQAIASLDRALSVEEQRLVAARIIVAAQTGERDVDALVAAGVRLLEPPPE